jgi:hypothetical protein
MPRSERECLSEVAWATASWRGPVVPPKMKDNPRKEELREALTRARSTAAGIPDILQQAATAMSAKAWTGGTSDAFSSGLSAQEANAKKGGTDSVEEIQTAYDQCPAQIEDHG